MAYTNPGMRERIKNRILAGNKGGKPGQWSARKAQLLAQAYEKAGGGYSGPKTSKQKSLSKWTKKSGALNLVSPALKGLRLLVSGTYQRKRVRRFHLLSMQQLVRPSVKV